MSEKLSTICEETSETHENFQEECTQELQETYVSFERYSDGASSIIYCTSPPLPPGLSKPSVSIKMGVHNNVKPSTWDRYATDSRPSNPEPNLSRSSKSNNFSFWKPSFFRPNTTSSSSTSATTSDRERDRGRDHEMLALCKRIGTAEQEIVALRVEVAKTRSMLEELKAQHSQVAPALPQVTDTDDLLSF